MSDRIAVFNEGRIQQLAPPGQLYEAPESLFVAEFVGENNRMEGVVAGDEPSGVRVRLADGTMLVSGSRPGLAVGTPVIVSVRPERVEIDGADAPNRLPATIDRSIFHGDAMRVVLRLPSGGELVAKVAYARSTLIAATGTDVHACFGVSDCRIFAKPAP